MNKIILRPGEKLTIEVKRKPAGGIIKRVGAAPSGGFIKSRRPADYPKRRRRSGSVINFYDLGEYLSSGIWIDDDRRITPTLVELNDHNSQNPESDLIPYFSAQVKDKYNLPASILPANWKNTFKRIGYEIADQYDFNYYFDDMTDSEYVDTENPNWTESGMKFSKKPQNYISTGQGQRYDKTPATGRFYTFQNLFYNIFLPDGSLPKTIKITESLDFNADEVNFDDISLDVKPLDFYFNRLMYFSNATVRQIDGSGHEYLLTLNNFFYVMTKEMSVGSIYNVVRESADYKLMRIDSVKMASHISGARQHRLNGYGAGGDTLTDDGSPSSFFLDGTPYDGPVELDEYFNSGIVQTVVIPSGSLLAAINQGAKWYFIWRA